MRTASALAIRTPRLPQKAHCSLSIRFLKAKKTPANRVNPGVIKVRITAGTQRPIQAPGTAEGQTEGPRTESQNESSNFRETAWAFLHPYRKYIIYWAVGSAAWYLFVGICYAQDYETVPITGRRRFTGSLTLGKPFAGEQKGTETGSIVLYFPLDLKTPILAERVRTVLQNIAFVAGLEDVQWEVRLLPSRESSLALSSPARSSDGVSHPGGGSDRGRRSFHHQEHAPSDTIRIALGMSPWTPSRTLSRRPHKRRNQNQDIRYRSRATTRPCHLV